MKLHKCRILTHAFFPTETQISKAVSGLSESLRKYDWELVPLSGVQFQGLAHIKIYEVLKALKNNRGGQDMTLLVDTDCSAISNPDNAFSYVHNFCPDEVLVSCAHDKAWPVMAWGNFMKPVLTPSGRKEKYFSQLNTGVICAKTDLLIETLQIFMDKVCAGPEMCDQHSFYIGHNHRKHLGLKTRVDGDSVLSISMAELDFKKHFVVDSKGVKRRDVDYYPVFAHMNGYVKNNAGVRRDFESWSGKQL
jgi:hypothetical protein